MLPLFSFASLQDGVYFFKKKDYKKALKEFLITAKDGMIAKYNIGYMYERGLGVKKNLEMAVKFYEMSANDGYAPAALKVGIAYLKGIGVKANLRKALYYLQIASKEGNKEAKQILDIIKQKLKGKK